MAAQFEECREKITEMPGIIRDLCRVLYFDKVDVMFTAFWIQSAMSFLVK